MKNERAVEKSMENQKKPEELICDLKRERKELHIKVEQAIKEREMAIAAIPHTCFYCGGGFQTEEGFECNECHYRGKNSECLNWRWKGEEKIREERLRKKREDVVCIETRNSDGIPVHLVYESIAEVLKAWWDEGNTDIPNGDDLVLKFSISGREIIPPKIFRDLIYELEHMYWRDFLV